MKSTQQIINKWKEYSTRVSYILCDDTLEDFWLNIIEEEKEALRQEILEEIKQLWQHRLTTEINPVPKDYLLTHEVLSLPSLSTPKQES